MKTSIATVCLSGSLAEKLDACAAAGFDGVEIFEQDLVVSPLSPAEIRARADRLGLTLDLYQPFRDLEAVPEEQFRDNLRRLEAKFGLMQELGMDLILLCSNVGTASVDDEAVMVSQLRAAAELAAQYGIRIAYEALAWGKYVNTYSRSWELVRAADHPNLGICLDSFHVLSRGDDPAGIAEIPGNKIFFVQLADAPTLGMDILPWSRHHRVFPGEGNFDLTGFTQVLLEAGYSGPLSLEIFNDVFREADPRATAVDAMRSLVWLQQRARGRFAEGSALREMLTAVDKLVPVEAVDHVEIATDAPEEFGALLGTLGFTFQGTHRRKQAQLFTCGQARVVLSPVAAGAGTRIASVAVLVPSASVAASRAAALGAPAVPRPVTADETPLPGVVAPGGWKLVFVDQAAAVSWPQEFGAHEHPSAGRSGGAHVVGHSLKLDHVNLPEPRTHFDASVLFLEAMLRLEPTPSLDVPSPRGLVRSQVLESPEAGVRWVLNLVPAALEDASGKSEKYPAHLAFHVDSLEEFAAAARARGLAPLSIPTNYYADLRARFGLDAELVSRWQEAGILYDRDATGEFLHLYTRSVGGVFLEVVERVGGYTGYGPGDAAVRLAAQEVGL
ncbi:MAG: TIM barrel protein [Galactobacter sp.]